MKIFIKSLVIFQIETVLLLFPMKIYFEFNYPHIVLRLFHYFQIVYCFYNHNLV